MIQDKKVIIAIPIYIGIYVKKRLLLLTIISKFYVIILLY